MQFRVARHLGAMALATALISGGTLTACAQDRTSAPSARTIKAKAKPKVKVKIHKVAIQVTENNPQLMNLALNNARNLITHYKKLGEKVQVEIVTFGPGLHMLRDDTSPVKQRVATMALENPELTFAACLNTRGNMGAQESKEIKLVSEAKVTPSGIVRLSELQQQGYSYIRP